MLLGDIFEQKVQGGNVQSPQMWETKKFLSRNVVHSNHDIDLFPSPPSLPPTPPPSPPLPSLYPGRNKSLV